MKGKLFLLFSCASFMVSTSAYAQANSLMSSPASAVGKGETFTTDVRFLVPRSTLVYEVSITYNPVDLHYVSRTENFDIPNNAPCDALLNNASQESGVLRCTDDAINANGGNGVLPDANGGVTVLTLTFQVLSTTPAASSAYQIQASVLHPTDSSRTLMTQVYDGPNGNEMLGPNSTIVVPEAGMVTISGNEDISSPTNVGNSSPANSSKEVSITPILSAKKALDDSTPINYEFELFENSNCTGAALQNSGYHASMNWSPPIALSKSTTYSWHNRARDSAPAPNESAYGACWSFKTLATSDTIAPNVNPSDSAVDSGTGCRTATGIFPLLALILMVVGRFLFIKHPRDSAAD